MRNRTPPLLPEETLRRVLRVANFDGLTVLAITGLLALVQAAAGDYRGAAIGLAVAAAGAIELHGAALMRAGEKRGMRWVVASQPYMLIVLLGYCALQLLSYDPTLMRAAMTDEVRATIVQAGYGEDQFLRLVYRTTYLVLAVLTVIYQGGMALYYHRRRAAVLAALDGEGE